MFMKKWIIDLMLDTFERGAEDLSIKLHKTCIPVKKFQEVQFTKLHHQIYDWLNCESDYDLNLCCDGSHVIWIAFPKGEVNKLKKICSTCCNGEWNDDKHLIKLKKFKFLYMAPSIDVCDWYLGNIIIVVKKSTLVVEKHQSIVSSKLSWYSNEETVNNLLTEQLESFLMKDSSRTFSTQDCLISETEVLKLCEDEETNKSTNISNAFVIKDIHKINTPDNSQHGGSDRLNIEVGKDHNNHLEINKPINCNGTPSPKRKDQDNIVSSSTSSKQTDEVIILNESYDMNFDVAEEVVILDSQTNISVNCKKVNSSTAEGNSENRTCGNQGKVSTKINHLSKTEFEVVEIPLEQETVEVKQDDDTDELRDFRVNLTTTDVIVSPKQLSMLRSMSITSCQAIDHTEANKDISNAISSLKVTATPDNIKTSHQAVTSDNSKHEKVNINEASNIKKLVSKKSPKKIVLMENINASGNEEITDNVNSEEKRLHELSQSACRNSTHFLSLPSLNPVVMLTRISGDFVSKFTAHSSRIRDSSIDATSTNPNPGEAKTSEMPNNSQSSVQIVHENIISESINEANIDVVELSPENLSDDEDIKVLSNSKENKHTNSHAVTESLPCYQPPKESCDAANVSSGWSSLFQDDSTMKVILESPVIQSENQLSNDKLDRMESDIRSPPKKRKLTDGGVNACDTLKNCIRENSESFLTDDDVKNIANNLRNLLINLRDKDIT